MLIFALKLRLTRLFVSSSVDFLILPIHTTFQSLIIKDRRQHFKKIN